MADVKIPEKKPSAEAPAKPAAISPYQIFVDNSVMIEPADVYIQKEGSDGMPTIVFLDSHSPPRSLFNCSIHIRKEVWQKLMEGDKKLNEQK